MTTIAGSLMILIAGPYRSGTGDDPVLIARNVAAMNDMAVHVFRAGHLPVLGEWFALPLIEHAGSTGVGDGIFNEIFHPVSRRVVAKCDACLRIGGPSAGADEMVAITRALGKPVFFALHELPAVDVAAPEVVIETQRLTLRKLTLADASFALELVNEPGWLRFIGDKGVRNLDDARNYLNTGPLASYARCGFGLYLVSLKSDGTPIGFCGLLKRDTLPEVDIGFALLQRHGAKGYAQEAAAATIRYACDTLGLKQVLAITTQDNVGSANVLGKIGMRFDKLIKMSPSEPELRLFALN